MPMCQLLSHTSGGHRWIEIVLNTIQYKIAKYREKKLGFGSTGSSTSSPKFERVIGSPNSTVNSPFPDNMNMTITENTMIDVTNISKSPSPTLPKTKNIIVSANHVDMEILLEKEEEIRGLKDTIEILEFKIGKLESLIRIKDELLINGKIR